MINKPIHKITVSAESSEIYNQLIRSGADEVVADDLSKKLRYKEFDVYINTDTAKIIQVKVR